MVEVRDTRAHWESIRRNDIPLVAVEGAREFLEIRKIALVLR
jgi:hypothetical protein